MGYRTTKRDNYTVILLTDAIDMSYSKTARQQILDALSQHENVLVDLSGVTYIDSSGVASLVEGFQTAKAEKLDFSLIGVSEAAMMVFKLARLDKIFPIFDTFEQKNKLKCQKILKIIFSIYTSTKLDVKLCYLLKSLVISLQLCLSPFTG